VDAEDVASAEYVERNGAPARAVLAICPSCGRPMLVARELGIERRQDAKGEEPRRSGIRESVPPVERGAHPRIPDSIRMCLEEARRCLEHGCYFASAVMCRRTIEALCKRRSAKGKDLAACLKELHQAKVIDDRLNEWAEALRVEGSLAAHDPDATFSRQDAEELIEFSEAIVEYVFVFSDRFAAFKARRAKAATAKPTEGAKAGTSVATSDEFRK
jgi:HEPN domain-containing protein